MGKKHSLLNTLWKFAVAAAGFAWKAAVWTLSGAWKFCHIVWDFSKKKYDEGKKEKLLRERKEKSGDAEFEPMKNVKEFSGNAEEFEKWLYSSKSTVGIILGSRGSGKSALGMRLLENFAARRHKAYAMGFDQSSMPSWIEIVDSVEKAGNGGVLLVDESGIEFSSRESMSDANKLLSRLLLISRHKDISLIFIAQNSANLEINSIRQADYLLLKKPSLLQKDFERGKIRDIYAEVDKEFVELSQDRGLVYVYSDKFRGFASNNLPSFWSENASKSFRNKNMAEKKEKKD